MALDPDAAIGVNADHVPSGAALFPLRALMLSVEPDAVHVTAPQFLFTLASKTREVNKPDAAYGVTIVQSIGSDNPELSLEMTFIAPLTA